VPRETNSSSPRYALRQRRAQARPDTNADRPASIGHVGETDEYEHRRRGRHPIFVVVV
jgi:hypothetical protein